MTAHGPNIGHAKARAIVSIDTRRDDSVPLEGRLLDLRPDGRALVLAGGRHVRTHRRFLTVVDEGDPVRRGTPKKWALRGVGS